MLGSMLVGFIIGLIAAAITNRGLLGAWIGQSLFGTWGPLLHDTAVVPSILGAVILLAIFWRRES